MKVKSESEVAQSCLTLSNPMDCSLPGSSIHGIFQARVLEWGAIAFSDIAYYILAISKCLYFFINSVLFLYFIICLKIKTSLRLYTCYTKLLPSYHQASSDKSSRYLSNCEAWLLGLLLCSHKIVCTDLYYIYHIKKKNLYISTPLTATGKPVSWDGHCVLVSFVVLAPDTEPVYVFSRCSSTSDGNTSSKIPGRAQVVWDKTTRAKGKKKVKPKGSIRHNPKLITWADSQALIQ